LTIQGNFAQYSEFIRALLLISLIVGARGMPNTKAKSSFCYRYGRN
jgi:hypothetical protein